MGKTKKRGEKGAPTHLTYDLKKEMAAYSAHSSMERARSTIVSEDEKDE